MSTKAERQHVELLQGTLDLLILKTLSFVTELRPSAREEGVGLDVAFHGEEAYTNGEGAVLMLDAETTPRPALSAAPAVARPAARVA